nr:zinc finger protein 506-like [Bactrocera oleae]
MNICGSVFVSKDVLNFALKCLYCEEDIQEWESFVNHIQSLHNSDLEEPCIDPIVELDYKENNALEWLKDEVMPSTDGDHWNESVDALKVEVPSDGEAFKTEPTEDPVSDNDGDQSYDDDNDSNPDSDSSHEYLEKSKQKAPKKFKPSFYRNNKNTNVFIEMFEKSPCLWNPNDENYTNNTERSKCKTEMIQEMEKRCQITLTYKKLWECFRELHMLYKTVGEAIEKKSGSRYKKLSPTVLGYYEKCSFLSVALDGFLDIFEDTPNTVTNISFASKNTITIAFIDTYERFPSLYDYKHPDYYQQAKRRLTYKEMADILRIEQNVEFTDDDIFKGIEYMRQWYFKLKKRLGKNLKFESLTKAAQHYVEKLAFLTRRSRGEKRFDTDLPCTECGEIFTTNAGRQAHLHKVHNIGELPYKCHLCDKSFSNNPALSGHKRRFHTEKIHKCEFCDKSYAIPADLRNHMGIHTGHKPFICELCGKGFRNKTKLRFHNDAIHLKLRAFKCTMCPKDFLKARDLQDHIKAHLNIRDKICDTCGKDFTSAHGLHRHKQLHAEVKKYACKFCEKRFYQFVGLNSHMKHRHGIYKNGAKKTEKTPETAPLPQTSTTNMHNSVLPNFFGNV